MIFVLHINSDNPRGIFLVQMMKLNVLLFHSVSLRAALLTVWKTLLCCEPIANTEVQIDSALQLHQ